jgi:hypothetical protein
MMVPAPVRKKPAVKTEPDKIQRGGMAFSVDTVLAHNSIDRVQSIDKIG